jgi:hypothetical protein
VWNPDKTGSNRHNNTSTNNTSNSSDSSDSDSDNDDDSDMNDTDVEATVGDMNITVRVEFPTESFSNRHQRALNGIEVIDLD